MKITGIKEKNKKRGLMILTLMMLVMLLSIPAQAAKIKLNRKQATITTNQTIKLKVKGTGNKVKWSSNHKNIATVSGKGVVRGINPGTSTITAKVAGKKLRCVVTVINPTSGPTPGPTASNNGYYTKLADYIIRNGDTNSDNNKFISVEEYKNGEKTVCGIVYKKATDTFTFIAYSEDSDSNWTIGMDVDTVDNSYVNPEIYYELSSVEFKATANIYKPDYTTKKDIDFTITNMVGYAREDLIQRLLNITFKLSMAKWDNLLLSKLTMRLKNLGFSSY